jgi:hypothetical protein
MTLAASAISTVRRLAPAARRERTTLRRLDQPRDVSSAKAMASGYPKAGRVNATDVGSGGEISGCRR